MQTFTTFALKSDIRVSENTVDQLVHGRFFKPTSLATFTAEGSGSLDLLSQKLSNVWMNNEMIGIVDASKTPLTYASILSADKAARYATTLHFLAIVSRRIRLVSNLRFGFALI